MAEFRHRSLGLTDDTVLEMYETIVLTRKLDERMWLLNRSGKIPFVISGQGHEGAQIGAAYALDRTKDYILPYYRDLGVVLSFGMTPREIMLSAFAKAEDQIPVEDRCQVILGKRKIESLPVLHRLQRKYRMQSVLRWRQR